MGKAFCRHEVDGRRYYRIDPKRRWEILRDTFRRQMSLWEQYQRHQKAILSVPPNNNNNAIGSIATTNTTATQLGSPAQINRSNGNGTAFGGEKNNTAKRKENNKSTATTLEGAPSDKRKRVAQESVMGNFIYNGNGKDGAASSPFLDKLPK